MKQNFIAVQVGVHPSTISRELIRNIASRGRTAGLYSAERAQKKAQARHEEKSKLTKFDTKLKETPAAMLIEKKWSPELISRSGDCPVSHEFIYRCNWGGKHGNKQRDKKFKKIYKHLRHGRKRRKCGNRKDNRGVIPGRIPISEIRQIVERRSRLGDVEVDQMIGKNHKYVSARTTAYCP